MKKKLFYSYLYSPLKKQGVEVGSSEKNIIMHLYNNTFIKKHTTCSLRGGKNNKRQNFYLIINLVHLNGIVPRQHCVDQQHRSCERLQISHLRKVIYTATFPNG